jgi:hypothetical protein
MTAPDNPPAVAGRVGSDSALENGSMAPGAAQIMD